eukprot:s659_g7.t1
MTCDPKSSEKAIGLSYLEETHRFVLENLPLTYITALKSVMCCMLTSLLKLTLADLKFLVLHGPGSQRELFRRHISRCRGPFFSKRIPREIWQPRGASGTIYRSSYRQSDRNSGYGQLQATRFSRDCILCRRIRRSDWGHAVRIASSLQQSHCHSTPGSTFFSSRFTKFC